MKRVALVVTAVLVLVLGITSCISVDQSDTPTYTADQVIAVAQARYPSCSNVARTKSATPSISVNFVSDGYWRVSITCPQGYRFDDWSSSKTLYFYEATGALSFTQPDE